MKIYLAGATRGCRDDECITWRQRVKALLPGHECIDPMRRDYRRNETNAYALLVNQDKEDIDGCDVLFANYIKPSATTAMEILYAFERQKVVVLVNSTRQPLSPWLLYHRHALFDTLEDAATYVNDRLSCVA